MMYIRDNPSTRILGAGLEQDMQHNAKLLLPELPGMSFLGGHASMRESTGNITQKNKIRIEASSSYLISSHSFH
jgi:hypothetical protein